MLTCKECVHYDACHRMDREIPAESCRTFKNNAVLSSGDSVTSALEKQIPKKPLADSIGRQQKIISDKDAEINSLKAELERRCI